MEIDWSKAPEGATGAMVAHFDGGTTRRGDVEFIPNDEPCRSIYKEGPDAWVYHPAPAAPDWAGEGLPPAGTVCEVLNNMLDRPEWERCTILFMGKFKAIYESESCHERVADVSESWMISFRPLRTPEQIAAEEREKEVDQMVEDSSTGLLFTAKKICRSHAVALHNAGYRKIK